VKIQFFNWIGGKGTVSNPHSSYELNQAPSPTPNLPNDESLVKIPQGPDTCVEPASSTRALWAVALIGIAAISGGFYAAIREQDAKLQNNPTPAGLEKPKESSSKAPKSEPNKEVDKILERIGKEVRMSGGAEVSRQDEELLRQIQEDYEKEKTKEKK